MSLTKVADSQLPDFIFDPSGFSGSGTSADPFLNLATTNGTSIKSAVRAASTGNLNLSGTQTVDGIALVAGDRVLVKNQTTTGNNGIYVVATGAWARATDADSSAKITGAVVPVMGGTVNSNSIWINTTINATIGTTTVTFATVLKAGTNLTLTGNSLAVNAAPTFTTQTNKVSNTTAATTAFSPKQFRAQASGNGSSTSIVFAHGISGITSSSSVTVSAHNTVSAGWSYVTIDATNITVFWSVAPGIGTNNIDMSFSVK